MIVDDAARSGRPAGRAVLRSVREAILKTKLFWGLALVIIAGTLLSPVDLTGASIFLDSGNLTDVLRQVSIIGIIAVGMTLVILTGGIDVGSKGEIYDLLARLTAEGIAIVLVSSDLPELIGLCDRILVLCEGLPKALVERPDFSQELILDYATPHGSHSGGLQ